MKNALIVVDFQNDFITGALGFSKAADLREPICNRIRKAITDNEDLIFTLDTHEKDFYFKTKEGEQLPLAHCLKGSWGWQVDNSIKDFLPLGKVFEKSSFGCLELADYLKTKGYDRIELCGLVCSICVFSNAVLAKAACPEAEIVIDSSLTEDTENETKNKSLDALEKVFVTVLRRNN